MKNVRVRCDFSKIDIHRASFSRHSKSKKHLENMTQNNVVVPWNNPIKRVVKEGIKVSDTKVENQYYFTDRMIKVPYDINIDNHHDKHGKS